MMKPDFTVLAERLEFRKADIQRLLNCSHPRAVKIFDKAKQLEKEKDADPYNLRPTTVLPKSVLDVIGINANFALKQAQLQTNYNTKKEE